MAKKVKLNVDFTEDNHLIGISCHKKDYWLAYHVNEQLKAHLRRIRDFQFYHQKIDTLLDYSLFHDFQADEQLGFYLIANHNPDGSLFPELKNTDYFILVQGRIPAEKITEIQASLRGIRGVLTAFIPDTGKLKEYDNFLSDLELHMTSLQAKD